MRGRLFAGAPYQGRLFDGALLNGRDETEPKPAKAKPGWRDRIWTDPREDEEALIFSLT